MAALGVLLTGYLQKQGLWTNVTKRRYVVLTHMAIHFFKRPQGHNLFGEERGFVEVKDIVCVTRDESNELGFEIHVKDRSFLFYAETVESREAWVNALDGCLRRRGSVRRKTLTGDYQQPEVGPYQPAVVLVSVQPGARCAELGERVLARDLPQQGELVLGALDRDAVVLLQLNEGAVAKIPVAALEKSKSGDFFADAVGAPCRTRVRLSARCVQKKKESATPGSGAALAMAAAAPGSSGGGGGEANRLVELVGGGLALLLLAAVGLYAAARRGEYADALAAGALPAAGAGGGAGAGAAVELLLLPGAGALLAAFSLARAAASLAQPRAKKGAGSAPAAAAGAGTGAGAAAAAAGRVWHLKLLGFELDGEYVEEEASLGSGGGLEADATAGAVSGTTAAAAASAAAAAAAAASAAPPRVYDVNTIPQRFLDGCKGDVTEAKRRWEVTVAWREAEGVDLVLQEQQPYYELIKKNYPHFLHKTCKQGYQVYIEQPGGVDMAAIRNAGVTLPDLLRHYLFITEFLWNRVDPRETGRTFTILDMTGIGLRDLAGEVLEFVRRASHFVQEHYPERSFHIFIVNVPWYFSSIWQIVQPMVNEATRKKIHILKKGQFEEELLKFVPAENLPVQYGGSCTCDGEGGCRFNSPEELAQAEHVANVASHAARNSGGGGSGSGRRE